ncbi:MAG: hypothetical protein EBR82_36295 [Caulobacteraceae bacterium]|nr:hypothetical protein [Caulobacteraceae bacterium]
MDGSIKFDVSATTAKFDAAMGKVANSARSAGDAVRRSFSDLGSLIAGGAVVAGLQNILQRMDDISDSAKRLGVTTTDIQKVGNAAQIVGTDFDAVVRSMNKMGVQANKAARDGGELADAFARVNIDPAKFAAASLADRVQMVAEAQRAANGDAQKMADLFEVVGVRAANINFAELVAEMQNVNAASESTVEALARANDELDKAKQNAAIFGANLLKALVVDPAQRLGDLLANGPDLVGVAKAAQMGSALGPSGAVSGAAMELLGQGRTIDQINRDKLREKAFNELRDSGGFDAAGSDGERERMVLQRMDEILAKEKEITQQTALTSDQNDQAASSAEKRAMIETEAARFKQQMLEIDLKIREAQLAGDKEKEASLVKFKEWTEAAIKYEGDLDKASRDVNATLKERLKLQEDALQKTINQVTKEVELAETMAFGTEEAKKKARWMQVYEDVLAKTGDYDLARRKANAETAEPTKPDSSPQTSSQAPQAASIPENSNTQSIEERIGQMRGQALAAPALDAAQRLQNGRQFRSAVRAQERAQRAMDRAAESARRREFEKSARENSKTPEERAKEEAAGKKQTGKHGQEGGKSADPMQTVIEIHKLLTERLPIRVLAA